MDVIIAAIVTWLVVKFLNCASHLGRTIFRRIKLIEMPYTLAKRSDLRQLELRSKSLDLLTRAYDELLARDYEHLSTSKGIEQWRH